MPTDASPDTTRVLPPGATIARYTVTGNPPNNRLEAPYVRIEPYRDLVHAGLRDAWMIRKGFPERTCLISSPPHGDETAQLQEKALAFARCCQL